MAIPIEIPSLLKVLTQISTDQSNRTLLTNEFNLAFNSFITSTPSPLSSTHDIFSPFSAEEEEEETGQVAGVPTEEQMQQIIDIYYSGILELRDSLSRSISLLSQLHQVALETLVAKLSHSNDQLLKEVSRHPSLRLISSHRRETDRSGGVDD